MHTPVLFFVIADAVPLEGDGESVFADRVRRSRLGDEAHGVFPRPRIFLLTHCTERDEECCDSDMDIVFHWL